MRKLERIKAFGGSRPLSWAVIAGDTVHVAGMVGAKIDFDAADPGELTFPASVVDQMRQAYRNIGWILAQAGSSLDNIAQQTVFFTGNGAEVMDANQQVRREMFGEDAPASAMAGVSNLFHPECRLEIQVIAYRTGE